MMFCWSFYSPYLDCKFSREKGFLPMWGCNSVWKVGPPGTGARMIWEWCALEREASGKEMLPLKQDFCHIVQTQTAVTHFENWFSQEVSKSAGKARKRGCKQQRNQKLLGWKRTSSRRDANGWYQKKKMKCGLGKGEERKKIWEQTVHHTNQLGKWLKFV